MPGRLRPHLAGSEVSFKNPTTGERMRGILVDEIWLRDPDSFREEAAEEDEGWLETAFVAQLVEWGASNRRIRIAYYTRRPGLSAKGWVFGQYAPSLSTLEFHEILKRMQERGWFNGLIL
jgi:hypothetical protein